MTTTRTATRAAVTTTTTQGVRIAPAVLKKLRTELRAYAELKTQQAAIEMALSRHKGRVSAIREELGESSLEVDGFKVQEVRALRSTFNKEKFVELGGDIEMYNAAVESKPNRPYDKITIPGDEE